MKIHGLQKMTLLDYPGHVACTVFLSGCDYRCPFCHNYELACGTAPAVMDSDELLAFLSKRQGLLDGVAITGGEPCLHRDLPELLAHIRELGFSTKLDTNGAHPDLLGRILEDGLADYVAMDIKNCPAKWAVTAGRERVDLSPIRASISLIMSSAPDYEFRTTVVDQLHTAADFHGMGEMIRGAKVYYLQSFTDRDTVPFAGFTGPSAQTLETYANIARAYVKNVQVRGVD